MTVKIGDNNDNNLQGSQDGDWLLGKGGKDALDGLGGNDWLSGDEGEDVLFGGGGNDYLNGALTTTPFMAMTSIRPDRNPGQRHAGGWRRK